MAAFDEVQIVSSCCIRGTCSVAQLLLLPGMMDYLGVVNKVGEHSFGEKLAISLGRMINESSLIKLYYLSHEIFTGFLENIEIQISSDLFKIKMNLIKVILC